MTNLPDDVIARFEEHTAGGYLVFRIDENNNVVYDCDFDDEASFFALVSKAQHTLTAIQKLTQDQIEHLIACEGESE